MKASFDGVRKNLARDFNSLARTNLDDEQKQILNDLRNSLVGLLCMYDDNNPDGDCNCLIDQVRLEEILEDGI